MMNAVSTCFSKYANFQGRAARPEFWWFALFIFLVEIVIMVLASLIGDPTLPSIILGIFFLAIILPSLAVSIRRMHDLDKSGWWILISMVPVIGGIWYLVLCCSSGTPGPNRFGV